MGHDGGPLEYESREVRRPLVRAGTVAVVVSAAFVGAALWVMVPDLHNHLEPVVVGPWMLLGVVAGAAVWHVRGRVRRGRWQDARVGRWAMTLLVLGWALGGVGVAGKVFLPDPHVRGGMRVKCASNMRQIGSAILLYSNDNQNRYPDRLGQLLFTEDISAEVFVCPRTEDDTARGATTRAVVDALTAGGHLSYVYLGAGLKNDCDPDTVVLYEPLANHKGDGMNVLFGDLHVEFLPPDEARQIVDRAGAGERPVVWKRGGGK